MLAYQVCECTRSVPAQAVGDGEVDAERLQRAVGAGQLGQVGVGRRAVLVAGPAERVHPGVDVVAGPQGADQLGHVDPGAAVDLGRVLLGEDVDAHSGDVTARDQQASAYVPCVISGAMIGSTLGRSSV